MLTVKQKFKLDTHFQKREKNHQPNSKNNECMHITNVTHFNDVKLTNFRKNLSQNKEKNHLKKREKKKKRAQFRS